MENNLLYHCVIPVSYTHLDVYKRQTIPKQQNKVVSNR